MATPSPYSSPGAERREKAKHWMGREARGPSVRSNPPMRAVLRSLFVMPERRLAFRRKQAPQPAGCGKMSAIGDLPPAPAGSTGDDRRQLNRRRVVASAKALGGASTGSRASRRRGLPRAPSCGAGSQAMTVPGANPARTSVAGSRTSSTHRRQPHGRVAGRILGEMERYMRAPSRKGRRDTGDGGIRLATRASVQVNTDMLTTTQGDVDGSWPAATKAARLICVANAS